MAKKTKNDMTAEQQKQVLSNLKQATAAWILGVNGRTLRDRTDLPRNPDGTYNVRDLFAGIERTSTVPHLDTDDLEKVLVISDKLYNGYAAGPSAVGIFDALTELEDKHGPGVFIAFVRELLQDWGYSVEIDRKEYSPLTREEIQERIEAEIDEERQAMAADNLKVAVVCDNCHKLRRGRRWVKSKPPAGYVVSGSVCPDCLTKG